MPTLNDVMNEVQSLAHDLNNRVDDLDREQRRLNEGLTSRTGAMPAEYKESIGHLNARINELMDAIEEARLESLRPASGERKRKGPAHQAFMKAMRKRADINLLTPEEKAFIVPDFMPAEQKAMYAADATSGGFFAASDFMNELQAYQLLISPMRSIARVQKTSGEKIQVPSLQQDSNAYWAVEQKQFLDSQDATLTMLDIPMYEMRGLLKISQQNLEDSMFDLEGFVKERLAKQFAKLEGAGFINGNGVGKPRGLLSYNIKASASYPGGAGKNNVTDAIPYVPSGQAAAITADSVLNVLMDLKSDYAPGATYIFTRNTLNQIRLFKDLQQRPLWQPFAANGLPASIYDLPYREMPDMPEIGANTFPIVVGDFSNYLIGDRVTMNIQPLQELYAIQGLIGYIARRRVGGDVLVPEAFRALKVATA